MSSSRHGRLKSGRKRSRSTAIAAAVVLAATLTLALGSAVTADTASSAGTTVSVRLVGDWGTSILPPTVSSNASYVLSLALYDRLVDMGPGGKMLPYLAKSWTVSPTQIVFKLRNLKGVTCSDGTPMTPSIIANSVANFVQTSPFKSIIGSGPFSVHADRYKNTFTIKTKTPYNEMLTAFGQQQLGIICPAGLKPGADPQKAYGSGPFTLTSATHNVNMLMAKRAGWNWGPAGTSGAKLPDNLDFRVIINETTTANLLLSGELTTGIVSGPDVDRLIAAKSLKTYNYPSFAPHMIVFNMAPNANHPWVTDLKLRKALLTAIDPAAFNAAEQQGGTMTGGSIFGKEMNCWVKPPKSIAVTPNIADAKSQLAADGWVVQNGVLTKNGQKLSMTVTGSETQAVGPDYLAQALSAVGVDVKLKKEPYSQYGVDLRIGGFDMMAVSYSRPAPNPGSEAVFLSGKNYAQGGSNFENIVDPTLDSLWAKAAASTDAKRCSVWTQFQNRFLGQYYGVPAGAAASYWFSNGWKVYALTTVFDAMWLAPTK